MSKVMETSQTFQVSGYAGIFPDGCLSAGFPGDGLMPHLRADHTVGEGCGADGDRAWLATVCDPQVFLERPDSLSSLGLCVYCFLSWRDLFPWWPGSVLIVLQHSWSITFSDCLLSPLGLGHLLCPATPYALVLVLTRLLCLRHREMC